MPKARAYRDFRVGDLFVATNGDTDIQSTHINGLGVPVVSAGTKNNGIIGLSDIKAKVFEPETITIDMFGNCYFQNDRYKMVTHARVFSLSPLDFTLNEKRGLYLVSQFSFVNKLFSYGNMASWQKIKDFYVSLPVLENGEIDFLFIDNYMQAIKDYCIKEMNDYLDAAGFEDCTLTTEEKQALNNANQGKVSFTSRPIGSLINGQTGDVDIQNKDINGKGCYFINSGITEFGIKGKTDRKARTFAPNTITIDFFGNAYYRPFEYKLATHNHVFSYSGDCIKNEAVGLYLVTQLGYLSKVYSYSNMGTMPKYSNHEIELPVDSNGSIDYALMETYIRAIMKQTIGKLKAAMVIDSKDYSI